MHAQLHKHSLQRERAVTIDADQALSAYSGGHTLSALTCRLHARRHGHASRPLAAEGAAVLAFRGQVCVCVLVCMC